MYDETEYREARDLYRGYCSTCADWTRDCTEPDAEEYDCPVCGQDTVVGADNWLMEQ